MSKNMSVTELVDNEIKYKAFYLELIGDISILRKSLNLHTPGFLVKDGKISKWFFKGFSYKEKPLIYGDYFEGRSLKELLGTTSGLLPGEETLPLILKLIEAVEILQLEEGVEVRLQLDSVFFTDDGGVLFLPFGIISEITSNSDDGYKAENYALINNSYIADPDMSLSLSIASIVYKALTGVYPYEASTEEEINRRYRNSRTVAPRMINFLLKKKFSDQIDVFFNNKNKRFKTDEWKKIVKEMLEQGATENINDEEMGKQKIASDKIKIAVEKGFRRNYFLERYKAAITTTAIVSVIGIIIAYNIFGIITKPKSTKGYTPLQVVEAYFKSFNTLDEQTFNDCVVKGLANEDSSEITYLFLFDKQTQAYEMKSYFIPADKWVGGGKKPISKPYIVFGISNLSLTEDSAASNTKEAVFSASFEKWKTDINESSGERHVIGVKINEKIYLEKMNQYWIIYRFEKLEESPIN